ncbi:MAG TPA: DUF4412 domain-containing protein [Gemmatimonadaceae bacterium]|nr:DUF4412 domain-containing protein [Gemmatimonadaceae bacterium]
MNVTSITATAVRTITLSLVVLVLSSTAVSRAAAQGSFEGTITYSLTGIGNAPATITYSQKGGKLRQDISMSGAPPMVSIHDNESGEGITLMPQMKKYMVINYKTMSEQMKQMAGSMSGGTKPPIDFAKMKVTPTGKHESVAGVGCDHYTFAAADSKDDTQVDICGATGMGFFAMTGDVISSSASTAALMKAENPQLARLAANGFFALKMSVNSKGKPVTWEATHIEKRSLDNSLFKPPSDYTPFTIPGMPGKMP